MVLDPGCPLGRWPLPRAGGVTLLATPPGLLFSPLFECHPPSLLVLISAHSDFYTTLVSPGIQTFCLLVCFQNSA